MNIKQRIKILCIKSNKTQADLAEVLGMSASNLSVKLKYGNLSLSELEQIAKATNTTFENYFRGENGEKI